MWATKKTEIVHSNDYWKVRKNEFITEDNYKGSYEFIDITGGGVIIPITNENRVLLIKQYRYVNDGAFFEFPCGGVKEDYEEKELYLQDARRELEEETGFKANSIEKVGYFFPYIDNCEI